MSTSKEDTVVTWKSQLLFALENNLTVVARSQNDRISHNSLDGTPVELAIADALQAAGWATGGRQLLIIDLDRDSDEREAILFGAVKLLGQVRFLAKATREDPLLLNSAIVIFKPGAESRRRLEVDLVAGLLRKIQARRNTSGVPLRIVQLFRFPSSELLWKTFWRAPETASVYIGEQQKILGNAIQMFYARRHSNNYFLGAIEVVLHLEKSWRTSGFTFPFYILVFVVTVREVEDMVDELQSSLGKSVAIEGLAAGCKAGERDRLIRSPRENSTLKRYAGKVLVSTSAADDLFIQDLTHVVDCGLVKVKVGAGFEHNRIPYMETVAIIPESRSLAAKRAGKVVAADGVACFRLFTENQYRTLADVMPPEVLTENLTPLVLRLLLLGVSNPHDFALPTKPSSERMARALESLAMLDIVEPNTGVITKTGQYFSALHPSLTAFPELGKAVIESQSLNCVEAVSAIAALVLTSFSRGQRGEIFRSDEAKQPFAVAEGDLLTLFNAYQAYTTAGRCSDSWCSRKGLNHLVLQSAMRLSADIVASLPKPSPIRQQPTSESLETRIGKALTAGLFQSSCCLSPSGGYLPLCTTNALSKSTADPVLTPHPSSVLHKRFPALIVYCRCARTPDAYHMTFISVIREEWLLQTKPDLFKVRS